MKLKKITVALLGFSALVAAPVAFAAGATPWYVGGSIGQTTMKDGCTGFVGACDDKDSGNKFFGGYQFNPNLAVEASYVGMGKATASGVVFGLPYTGTAKATGWGAAAVGTLPVNKEFSVFGKLGVVMSELKYSEVYGGVPYNFSGASTGANFGFGAKYDFSSNVAVRAEWERFSDVGNEATTGTSDIDMLSIGVVFKF